MRRTRENFTKTGHGIKAHLTSSELSVDQGLIAQAQLIAAMLSARIELGMDAGFQRDLIRDTGHIFTHMMEGRERMISIHQRFSAMAMKLGLEPSSFGDSDDKDKPVIADAPALSVVPAGEERHAA